MGNKTITIGRDKKCDLVIEDKPQNARVSGRHATITEVNAEGAQLRQFVLEDHSKNGTYVNFFFVHNGTYKLQVGDTITLGRDYILDWDLILPFFEGRNTNRKQVGEETVIKPNSGVPPAFVSADPIYPDPWPIVDDGATAPHASPNNGIGNNDEKKFVFNGYHWLITVGAFIVGFVLGMFL